MALLAYLAMRADEHVSRSHLAALLWCDSAEEQARTNLRQTLSQLRKLFRDSGRDPIMVPFDQVVLHSEGIEIDARKLLTSQSDVSAYEIEKLPEFLEGFTVPAPEFENWMTSQRNKVRSRLSVLLKTAADHAFTEGKYVAAGESLSLALTIDPLEEAVHRSLMKTLNAQGRTDAALAQYEACRKILARELQVEPDAETRKLAAGIRAQRLGTSSDAEPSVAFQRYPTSSPTLVFTMVRRLSDSGQDQPRQFQDAQSALSAALEQFRLADDPGSVTLSIVPYTGQTSPDRTSAKALIDCAAPGTIVVHERIYEQFRHWSPFSFEPNDPGRDDRQTYRLVSEMPRHKLQVMPANASPEVDPMAEFSVAVLPLKDRSPNAGDFALGDVIAEEITHRLARFRNLTVAAPSAGQAFRAQGCPIDDAQGKLGVNYLVDGNVFRSDDRLRVSLTLTDLRTNSLVGTSNNALTSLNLGSERHPASGFQHPTVPDRLI